MPLGKSPPQLWGHSAFNVNMHFDLCHVVDKTVLMVFNHVPIPAKHQIRASVWYGHREIEVWEIGTNEAVQ